MSDLSSDICIAIGILSVLGVVGTIGNALVLYVFSKYKQKLTSTIFILTLAGTDFITCCVTIPFTIVYEAVESHLGYSIMCQIYYFLITATVSFSAFVMVAIAVDRYICIVHPFKHLMTIRRAEIIVGCLCGFSVICGCSIGSFFYLGPTYTAYGLQTQLESSTFIFDVVNGSTSTASSVPVQQNDTDTQLACLPKKDIFFKVIQGIYSSFFGICCIIVMILYALIYRSILARRRKKFKVVTNKCCGFWAAIPNEVERTEITNLNNESKVEKEDNSDETKQEKDTELCNKVEQQDKAVQKNGSSVISDKDIILKPGGVSRAKLEKMRLANIKTAFMLAIVTFVFIVVFLPAWLMALEAIEMNFIIFYLYYVYNVANPIIYAFMNESFRNQLKQLVCCGRNGGPVRGGPSRHSHH